MRLVAPVVLTLALAACSSEPERVRKRECEAVLAHLTVLERGERDQPMCQYHPDCGGERADRYARSCTKVLGRTEADCYLRATTLDDADDCLRRDIFDDAIRTGRKPSSTGGRKRGDDDDPWFGGGGDRSPMGQMRDIRDEACACKDTPCAERIQQRFEQWARDNAATTTKPDDAMMKIAMEASECMVKAMSSAAYPYGGYDANPYDYKDPYGWRSGGTGMPACDEYFELVDDLMDCDAYPETARDAMRDSVASMKSAWGDPSSMSTSVRESTNDSCKMMVEAMEESMSAIGCP